jgi:hypothetical protein
MDAVKEAVIGERLDEFGRQFARAEERNREEHSEIRAEIRELRGETDGGLRELHRTMIFGFGSIVASVAGSAVAAILSHAL